MTDLTIWHNPRCSKSRATLALLEDRGLTPKVRRYLDDPPTVAELNEVLAKLGLPAMALVRTGEKTFREAGLAKDSPQDLLVAAMAVHPILIERPVVQNGGRAALGRPPEAVLAIL